MRKILAGVFLLGVAGTILGVILSLGRQESDDLPLRKAARTYIVELGTEQGWGQKTRDPIDSIDIVARSATTAVVEIFVPVGNRRFYLDLFLEHGHWKVARNLDGDFRMRVFDSPEIENQMVHRLGQRMMERFHVAVNVRPGMGKEYRIERHDRELVGFFILRFGSQMGGPVKPGRYVETFSYVDGQWKFRGGQLFDLP